MAFDINAFVMEEASRAIQLNSDNSVAWYTNQVQDFSVKVDGEEQTKKDARGNTILTISKGKTCELSFNTPVYDVNIVAAQNGTQKEVASESVKFIAPAFEEFEIKGNATTVTLKNAAKKTGETYNISVSTLTDSGSPKAFFKLGSATDANTVVYTESTKKITFADNVLSEGDTVLVVYEYEASEAVRVAATGNDFPKTGKVYVEVKGYDICDQSTVVYGYYRFPNAKMKSSYQHDLNLDSTIAIQMDCALDYCSKKKEFYDLVIPSSK